MNSVLNQALSALIIIGCNLSFASSFGIIESSVLSPSLPTTFLENLPTNLQCNLPTCNFCDLFESLPTHSPYLQNAHSIFNGEESLDINTNFHLVASVFESEKSQKAIGIGDVLSEYDLLLKQHPYSAKIVTGVILAIFGDFIAQLREDDPYDVKRAAAFALFDGCYRAVQQLTYPTIIAEFQGQHILGVLGSLGYTSLPVSSAVFGPLEQTLISQLVIIPTIYYPVFFTITGFIQGLSFQETLERAKKTFVPLMKRNLLFWIPVQFAAFAYIPQNQQISVLIVCGLVWTVILSVSAGAIKAEDSESESKPLPEVGMSDINNAMKSTTIVAEYDSGTVKR